MSDIRDRYPVGSPEWWINGHGLRRAGEDEIRRDERFLAAARPTPPKDEGERRDAAVNAGIQSRLTDRSVHTPTKLWGMEIDWSAICPNPGLHATRKFVDSQMAVWLTAADVYLPGVPSRECCEATGDFILGKSEAPGEFEECVRCRCMLVAHEVAWETAVRALPRGVPRPVEVECPPLDGNGVGLPRVLLRLALEADSVAAEAESCLGDQHVEPRVPITSGIGPLWDWLA
ncbi:MAG: hypothetical protein JKY37_19985, partial [Nannocystaceae bacterium]|nr:hypothetical protein [Nannocystaceae bacterium]